MLKFVHTRLQPALRLEYCSLSEWLMQLAQCATNITKGVRSPSMNKHSSIPKETSNSLPSETNENLNLQQIWESIMRCSQQAYALREVDTLFSIVQCLCDKQLFPNNVRDWATLAERLLLYSDVEINAVLHYPGMPDAQLRLQTSMNGANSSNPTVVANELTHTFNNTVDVMSKNYEHNNNSNNSSINTPLSSSVHCRDWMWERLRNQQQQLLYHEEQYFNKQCYNSVSDKCNTYEPKVNYSTYQLFPSRETLLMTGGVVPLSSRASCADGEMIGLFVNSFTSAIKQEMYHLRRTTSGLTNTNLNQNSSNKNNYSSTCCSDCTSNNALPKDRYKELYSVLEHINSILISVLHANMNSIDLVHICLPLTNYMQLLRWIDISAAMSLVTSHQESEQEEKWLHKDLQSANISSNDNREQKEKLCCEEREQEQQQQEEQQQQCKLLNEFVECLCKEITINALGAKVVLHYLTSSFHSYELEVRQIEEFINTCNVNSNHNNTSNKNNTEKYNIGNEGRSEGEIDVVNETLKLELVKHVVENIYRYFTRPSSHIRTTWMNDNENNRERSESVSEQLQILYNDFDLLLQYNANQNNPLHLPHNVEESIRVFITLALLRALRMQSHSPEVFLENAIQHVDKCSAAMRIEAEIIYGKAALLSHFTTLEESAREAIYNDLIHSLQNMIELRPRKGLSHTHDELTSEHTNVENENILSSVNNSNNESNVKQHHMRFTLQRPWKWKGNANSQTPTGLDSETQQIMQNTHACVINVLCKSNNEKRINDAYGMVISHKYHGLLITTQIIHPLLEVLSKSGDGRVFNLVDVCVLYSNCTINMQTIVYLVHACAVAGDHYRARALMVLLKDIYPGFLLAAPNSVREELRELQVLNPIPAKLFTSKEEKMVQEVMNNTKHTSLRPLPDNSTSVNDKYKN